MSKAEMILYSPASYFLCIIVVQIIKEPIFYGISVIFFIVCLQKIITMLKYAVN